MPVYHTAAGTIEMLEWGEGPGVRPEAWIVRLCCHCERSEAISIPLRTVMEIARMLPGLLLGSLRS